jgi:PIN domain nuclease of toxin-antitoxin system
VILLDTHIVIWLAFEPKPLSPSATQAIKNALALGEPLAISAVTLYELANEAARERIGTLLSLDDLLEQTASRFLVRPINERIAARSVRLSSDYPRDPMDRIIGATALVEDLQLITADQAIRRSRIVPTIW